MRTKRRLHLSLYYEIRNILVREGYLVSSQGETLDNVSGSVYQANHSDWVYQDLTSYPVKVYDDGVLVEESRYRRDFREGKIVFTSYEPGGEVSLDYTYNQINMRQAYPPQDSLSIDDLPLFVIVPQDVPRYPMALGAKLHQSDYNFRVDFLGQTLGQMEDVTEAIEEWLLEDPIFYEQSFSSGFPLLDDGEINSDYSKDQYRKYHKQEVRGTPFIAEGTTKVERFRYAIDFILMNYKNYLK